MPGSTPILNIPYALLPDSPNAEELAQSIADRIEEILLPAGIVSGDALIWNGAAFVAQGVVGYSEGAIGDRPATGAVETGHVFHVTSGADEGTEYRNTAGGWVEITGGGPMVSAYLESDAEAGVTTGQTAFGTTFATLNDLDGSPSQFTIPEDGAYEFEIQLAGDLSSTGQSLFARVRRESDGAIVFSRGWNDIDRETSQGTGAASTHVMGAGVESTADPRVRRRVQLDAGTVLELDVRTGSGTLTPNRNLTNVTADKKADTGGAVI